MDKKSKLLAYIKQGEKSEDALSLGVEMEHFVIDNATGRTVGYFGPDGVGETLKDIEKMGFQAHREGDNILSLEQGAIQISTEPGSQFEIAITSSPCIMTLEREYVGFMRKMVDLFAEKGQSLVTLGYHPVSKIDDLRILPKKRYDYMYRYFEDCGSMAHNMMKGTASLQVTIDYKNEADFVRKYRTLNALSPIFYALFDNAAIFEGQPAPFRNVRSRIWENTDRERSGIWPLAFDPALSYEKYVDHILQTPIIFREIGGQPVYEGHKTILDAMLPEDDDAFMYHALSIVFPDVRLKRYIEIRMMDSVPYPLNFSAMALIKGLFYKEKNLDVLYQMSLEMDYDKTMALKKEVEKKGIEAEFMGMTVRDFGLKLIRMAKKEMLIEKRYLIYLQDLLEENKTPRDLFVEKMDKESLKAAIDINRIKKEDFRC